MASRRDVANDVAALRRGASDSSIVPLMTDALARPIDRSGSKHRGRSRSHAEPEPATVRSALRRDDQAYASRQPSPRSGISRMGKRRGVVLK